MRCKVPQIIHHIVEIDPPDVVGPHFPIDDQQQKSFLALSFDSLFSLTLLRPVDHLATILRQQLVCTLSVSCLCFPTTHSEHQHQRRLGGVSLGSDARNSVADAQGIL